MPALIVGFSGIAVGVAVLVIVALVVSLTPKGKTISFDAPGDKGSYVKLLQIYVRLTEFILGLAAGGIVLLVSSFVSHANGQLPWVFVSPLCLLALCIVYGVLFMVFLITEYADYRQNPDLHPYTRFKYTTNHALGFGGLICFCLGYGWLVFVARTWRTPG